ncbi:hypothetical protein BDV12DRAFT_79282 [Aspergillus spectabilis]
MPQTSLQPSPLKEGRRILSEKSANACFSAARSPVKQTILNSSSPKKLLPSPSFVAQKRSIGQVDGEGSGTRGILHVQQRVEEREAAPAHHEASARSITDMENRSTPDAMNLDEHEPTIQQPLHQDPDKTGAQLTSQDSESTSIPTPQTVPSDPTTRKLFIQEKASLLRNRLQSAMRHVRDPQFDRRLSVLEEHSRKYPRLSAPGSGSGSETQVQQHLERKYGIDGGEDDDEVISCTPRVSQQTQREEQRELDDEDEDETTPTQDTHVHMHAQRTDRATSPIHMLLSSPTYNSNPGAQKGRFNDDRPRETTIDTSPSSSQRKEGDGDAVDGLLKLMGRNATAEMVTETDEYVEGHCEPAM